MATAPQINRYKELCKELGIPEQTYFDTLSTIKASIVIRQLMAKSGKQKACDVAFYSEQTLGGIKSE